MQNLRLRGLPCGRLNDISISSKIYLIIIGPGGVRLNVAQTGGNALRVKGASFFVGPFGPVPFTVARPGGPRLRVISPGQDVAGRHVLWRQDHLQRGFGQWGIPLHENCKGCL